MRADATGLDTRCSLIILDANDEICLGVPMRALHSVLTANRTWDRRTADGTYRLRP